MSLFGKCVIHLLFYFVLSPLSKLKVVNLTLQFFYIWCQFLSQTRFAHLQLIIKLACLLQSFYFVKVSCFYKLVMFFNSIISFFNQTFISNYFSLKLPFKATYLLVVIMYVLCNFPMFIFEHKISLFEFFPLIICLFYFESQRKILLLGHHNQLRCFFPFLCQILYLSVRLNIF